MMSHVLFHLHVVGLSLILLALAHVDFSKRFHWQEELARVSLLNRQIFFVHSFFVCLVLVQMGLLCLLAPQTLLAPSPLGLYVTAGFTVFWTIRLWSQWFVYDWRLWMGKRLETFMHIIFTALWSYYVAVFATVARTQFLGT
jgi:hypothetical protein